MVLFALVCVSGWISVFVVKALWGYEDDDLTDPIGVSIRAALIYAVILWLSYNIFSRQTGRSLSLRYRYKSGARSICLLLFFVAGVIQLYFSIGNFGYNEIGRANNIPGGTIVAFILTWVPSIFIMERRRYGNFIGILAVAIFAVSLVRFNIVILGLVYLTANHKQLRPIFFVKTIIPIALIFILISTVRVDSGEDAASIEYTWAGTLAANFGAEWRDGILGEISLPEAELSEVRRYHLQSMIRPAIPFINYLPGMEPADLKEKQIYHLYVTEVGLDALGYTGIRVGMIWEMYYLYGYLGVIFLAVLNAFFISRFNWAKSGDSLNFGRVMLSISAMYSLIGQTEMYLGVFFQYIIFSVVAVHGLKLLAVSMPGRQGLSQMQRSMRSV